MSFKATGIAWAANLPDRNVKLCALVMADRCNDDGVDLHPSVGYVAKRMSCSDRTAQRALHQLIGMGLLEVIGNANGGRPGASRNYRLRLDRLAALAETGDNPDTRLAEESQEQADAQAACLEQAETGDRPDTGDKSDGDGCQIVQRGVTDRAETGDTDVTLSFIDPSMIQKKEKATRKALPDWVPLDAWNGFMEMRKRQRKVPTERACELLVGQLEKLRDAGHDPGAVLDRSTSNSWTGVFPLPMESRRPQLQSIPSRLTANQQHQQNVIGALTGRSHRRTIDVDATEVFAPALAR
jgi:hypothetical protein